MEQTECAKRGASTKFTTTTEKQNPGEQGKIMGTEVNLQTIDLDPQATAWLAAYTEAKRKIKEWQEKADLAAEQIKSAMGNHEIGLIDGSPAVRWTTVESKAIDVKKCRELLPEQVLQLVEITRISKRFTLVDEE